MATTNLVKLAAEALLAWMAAGSLAVVGYLLLLKIREMRRNRRFDVARQRLGLRRSYRPARSWLL
jgi:hypothetical protein